MRGSNAVALNPAGQNLDNIGLIPRQNILIIEDEQGILRLLEQLFDDNFIVLKARSGREGLYLFNTLHSDIVLLDLVLPEMDGLEVLKAIRCRSRAVPVIVITGHSTIERAERCADLTVQGYIRKPFEPFDLLEKVNGLLRENEIIGNSRVDHLAFGITDRLSGRIEEAITIISRHYTEAIRPRDVAAQVCASRKYLGRRFKRETGYRIDEYINRVRVERSKELLIENSNAKLSEVSVQMGFNSEAHFVSIFKKYTGMTPTGFRRFHR